MVQVVQNVGSDFEKQERFYRNRIRSPLTAIRAYCVLCEGGSQASSNCTGTQCPLWPYRKGKNSMFGKLKDKELAQLESENDDI